MKTNSSHTSKKKAELFNYFFVNQCSFLSNNIVLPTDLPQLTNKCLDSIHFSSSAIAKIITHLDPNKAHSHGGLLPKLNQNGVSGNRLTFLCNFLSC